MSLKPKCCHTFDLKCPAYAKNLDRPPYCNNTWENDSWNYAFHQKSEKAIKLKSVKKAETANIASNRKCKKIDIVNPTEACKRSQFSVHCRVWLHHYIYHVQFQSRKILGSLYKFMSICTDYRCLSNGIIIYGLHIYVKQYCNTQFANKQFMFLNTGFQTGLASNFVNKILFSFFQNTTLSVNNRYLIFAVIKNK